MTETKRIVYRLFAQAVLLFVLYAAVALLTALKFLADDPLATGLSYQQVDALAHVLRNAAILSGFFGGGVYIIANDRLTDKVANERLLTIAHWLWTAFVGLALIFGVLNLLSGRYLLELPPLLMLAQLVVIALFLFNIIASVREWTPFAVVFSFGLLLSGLTTAIALLPPADYLQDIALRALAVNLNHNVAYVLMLVALGFWLMRRFSNVMPLWANEGLYTTAGLLTIGGVLISIPPLYNLGASNALGTVTVFIVPYIALNFAGHSYRALRDRNPTETLAAHWYALALLLLLLGMGVLGALLALPGIIQWTQGTRLSDLQTTLMAIAAVAVVFGMINQVTAELREENRRITGLMPFWLVTFGILGGGFALAAAGTVQTYLERILSVGYLDTQVFIIPLYLLWIVGALLMTLGAVVYLLGFWARRPAASIATENP